MICDEEKAQWRKMCRDLLGKDAEQPKDLMSVAGRILCALAESYDMNEHQEIIIMNTNGIGNIMHSPDITKVQLEKILRASADSVRFIDE